MVRGVSLRGRAAHRRPALLRPLFQMVAGATGISRVEQDMATVWRRGLLRGGRTAGVGDDDGGRAHPAACCRRAIHSKTPQRLRAFGKIPLDGIDLLRLDR